MVETSGMRALNIARLEQRLEIIKQQMVMSCKYPDHQKKLYQTAIELQARLNELTKTEAKGDNLCQSNARQVAERVETFSSLMMRRSFVA